MARKQIRRTKNFRIRGGGLDGNKPDIVVLTSEGPIVVEVKTVKGKSQADAAIASVLGRPTS